MTAWWANQLHLICVCLFVFFGMDLLSWIDCWSCWSILMDDLIRAIPDQKVYTCYCWWNSGDRPVLDWRLEWKGRRRRMIISIYRWSSSFPSTFNPIPIPIQYQYYHSGAESERCCYIREFNESGYYCYLLTIKMCLIWWLMRWSWW